MGQEITRLIEQVDPQLLVLDADMDMHAADEHPVGHGLHVVSEALIALLVDIVLLAPVAEGVRGGRDRGEAVIAAGPRDAAPEPAQLGPHLADIPADLRADLDLGPEELIRHLLAERPHAFIDKALRRVGSKRARLGIDQEIFLLDAQCERRFGCRHGSIPPLSEPFAAQGYRGPGQTGMPADTGAL